MIQLPKSISAWGSPEFNTVLKQEIEQLDADQLPLQQALTFSSHVTDRAFQARVLSVREETGGVRVKAGIFYTGVIAGCSCADDPTPVDELNEYCELQFDIDRSTGTATVTLPAE